MGILRRFTQSTVTTWRQNCAAHKTFIWNLYGCCVDSAKGLDIPWLVLIDRSEVAVYQAAHARNFSACLWACLSVFVAHLSPPFVYSLSHGKLWHDNCCRLNRIVPKNCHAVLTFVRLCTKDARLSENPASLFQKKTIWNPFRKKNLALIFDIDWFRVPVFNASISVFTKLSRVLYSPLSKRQSHSHQMDEYEVPN